ncbi:hypothetical protein ACHAWX_000960 [Stephanocyclus meneghinianus]
MKSARYRVNGVAIDDMIERKDRGKVLVDVSVERVKADKSGEVPNDCNEISSKSLVTTCNPRDEGHVAFFSFEPN